MALSTLAKGFVTPGISSSFGGAQTTKGWLGINKAKSVPFQYNPADVTVTLANNLQQTTTPKTTGVHSQGTAARKYDFKLIFDTYEDGENVWEKYIKKLAILFEPDPDAVKADTAAGTGRPPNCVFFFGDTWSREGYLTKCNVKYTMFLPDLTPARATVDITFQEAGKKNDPMQNPTSGGVGGDRSYTVQPGDTLEGIAFREFGNATQWRAIADANGIENPRDLKAGRRLAIPLL